MSMTYCNGFKRYNVLVFGKVTVPVWSRNSESALAWARRRYQTNDVKVKK